MHVLYKSLKEAILRVCLTLRLSTMTLLESEVSVSNALRRPTGHDRIVDEDHLLQLHSAQFVWA